MPRGPRLDAPDVLPHVRARGLERRRIFQDDPDREDFVRRLAALAGAGALTVYAWVLMPTHFICWCGPVSALWPGAERA